MVLLLAGSTCTPVYAATARATTMKLTQTEGTVKVKTQNGTTRKISLGMRLYNGNSVETGKESSAYISLDNSKAVKLDENTRASLRQKGKKLDILVKSGQMFFNVSKKLKDNESMNIRTSTMVTGIRGTCGIVEKVSPKVSKLYLLEGKVTFGGEEPVEVSGGQIATVTTVPTAAAAEPDIEVTDMVETDIPIFAAEEVMNDPVLQEKIEETTDLRVEKIEEHLEQSQKPQEPQEPVAPTEPVVPVEPTPPSVPETPEKPESPSEPEIPDATLTGTDLTIKDAEAAWEYHNELTMAAGSLLTVSGNETLTAPSGKKLTVASGAELKMEPGAALQIQSGGQIVAEGTITGNGSISIEGGGTVAGLVNNGTISAKNLTLTNSAVFINKGYMHLTGTCSGAGEIMSIDNALLICDQAPATQTYLAKAVQNGTGRYYYANGLNDKLAAEWNTLSAEQDVSVEFQRDAVVNSDIILGTGSGSLQLAMGASCLAVQSGTLTLTNAVSVSGSGSKAISMEGGKLVLGSSGSVSGREMRLENTESGYVIAVTDTQKTQTGVVTCYDQNLVVVSGSGVDNTIQGITLNQDKETVTMPAYVDVQNGLLEWRSDGNFLAYVPAEFDGVTLRAARVNLALQAHERVTIGEKARVVIYAAETVTVPEGKTLDIRSKVVQEAENKYTGGSDLEKGGTLKLESGASLALSGSIWGNGTIAVGGKANLTLTSDGSLLADEIKLENGSCITNDGVIDGGKITSSGGSRIVNNSIIRMKYAYTGIAGADVYEGSTDSILISGEESTAMPQNAEKSGSLLARMHVVSGEENLVTISYQFYYADVLNQRVADYMNLFISNYSSSGSCKCEFMKNALVPAGADIELKNMNATLGTYELQTAGNLTLTDVESVTGSGETVIRVLQGGTLTFNGSADSTVQSGVIQNTSADKTVIAADTAIIEAKKQYITWNDEKLYFKAEKSSIDKVIQGLAGDANKVSYDPYLKLPDGLVPVWDADSSTLKLDKAQ